MGIYTYKVLREYPDGSRAKRARRITCYEPLRIGGLYVRLGKGYPGMQRVMSEEKEPEDREGEGC